MNYDLKTARATLRAAQQLASFDDWLRSDGDCLIGAAELLGGTTWRAQATSVLDAITDGVPLAELADDLEALLSLLMLDHVDDLDSEEAALFLSIHPDDPRADEARICAEALERGLDAIQIIADASAHAQEAA